MESKILFCLFVSAFVINKIDFSDGKPFLYNTAQVITQLLGSSSSSSSSTDQEKEEESTSNISDYTKLPSSHNNNETNEINPIELSDETNNVLKKQVDVFFPNVQWPSIKSPSNEKQVVVLTSGQTNVDDDGWEDFDTNEELASSGNKDEGMISIQDIPSRVGVYILELFGSLTGLALGVVGQINYANSVNQTDMPMV